MTQEEKQLLLKDLCMRLPYNVKVNIRSDYTREMEDAELTPFHIDGLWYNAEYRNFRPYLRPLSSMTEKEKEEYELLIDCSDHTYFKTSDKVIDWLNARHFDYHGLIEKGLALEAPKGMYML